MKQAVIKQPYYQSDMKTESTHCLFVDFHMHLEQVIICLSFCSLTLFGLAGNVAEVTSAFAKSCTLQPALIDTIRESTPASSKSLKMPILDELFLCSITIQMCSMCKQIKPIQMKSNVKCLKAVTNVSEKIVCY